MMDDLSLDLQMSFNDSRRLICLMEKKRIGDGKRWKKGLLDGWGEEK